MRIHYHMEVSQDLPDIAVIGTGINKMHQMTLEGMYILQEADLIISNLNDSLGVEYIADMVDRNDADYIDLSHIYTSQDNSVRFEAYYEAISRPLEEAKQRDGLVAYIGTGHPSVWNFTTNAVKNIGERYWGLDVELIPAISAISDMYCKVGIDPSQGDVMQLSIPTALGRDIQIPDGMSLVGYLLGRIPIDTDYSIEYLVDYLSSQYYPEKKVYISRLRKNIFNDDSIAEMRIEEIAKFENHHDLLRGTLLFIPSDTILNQFTHGGELRPQRWTDEQVDQLRSGKIRSERPEIPLTEPVVRNESDEELMEIITRSIEDREFYIDLITNTEETINDFDITEETKDAIMEVRQQNKPQITLSSKISEITDNREDYDG